MYRNNEKFTNKHQCYTHVPVVAVSANPGSLGRLWPTTIPDSEMADTRNSYMVPGASLVTLKSLVASEVVRVRGCAVELTWVTVMT